MATFCPELQLALSTKSNSQTFDLMMALEENSVEINASTKFHDSPSKVSIKTESQPQQFQSGGVTGITTHTAKPLSRD